VADIDSAGIAYRSTYDSGSSVGTLVAVLEQVLPEYLDEADTREAVLVAARDALKKEADAKAAKKEAEEAEKKKAAEAAKKNSAGNNQQKGGKKQQQGSGSGNNGSSNGKGSGKGQGQQKPDGKSGQKPAHQGTDGKTGGKDQQKPASGQQGSQTGQGTKAQPAPKPQSDAKPAEQTGAGKCETVELTVIFQKIEESKTMTPEQKAAMYKALQSYAAAYRSIPQPLFVAIASQCGVKLKK